MKKLLVVLLLALSLLLCFASCDLFSKDEVPQENPHVCTPAAALILNEQEGTCEEGGGYDEVVYCADCHKELSREHKTTAPLDHVPASAVIENNEDATCQCEGSYDEVVYCENCNQELSRVSKTTEMLTHAPYSEVVIEYKSDATCYQEGSYDEVLYCMNCPEELSREHKTTAKLAHEPSASVIENRVEATCEAGGSYDEVVYCGVCGEELSRVHQTIPALKHSFTNYVSDNNATCTEDGTKTAICDDCDATHMLIDVGSKLGHSFTNYVSDNNATCTEDGTKTAVCDRCDKTDTQIDVGTKLDHSPSAAVIENKLPASCIQNGSYDEVIYCAIAECKAEISRTIYSIGAYGHDEVRYEAKNPTCTDNGWESYVTCSRCDYTTYNELGALGHDTIWHESKNSTCDFPGWDSYVTCSRCTYTTYKEIAAIEHSYLNGICINCDLPMPTDGLKYSLSSRKDYYIVTGVDEGSHTSIVIPPIYNGLPVTEIGAYAFRYNRNIMSVTIPESVTSIGYGAFGDCYKLIEIVNRSSLDIVAGSGIAAFAVNVHTGNGSGVIEEQGDYTFYIYCGNNYLVNYKGHESVPVLPEDYKGEKYHIWCGAFYNNDEINIVKLSDSVISIGKQAFGSCNSLMSLTIGSGVTNIGDYAFWECTRLVEIINYSPLTLTVGEKNYGRVAYYANEIHAGESRLDHVGDYFFYATSDGVNYLVGYKGEQTDLVLPNDYMGQSYKVKSYAFYYCDLLTSVIISNGITEIGEYAFHQCKNLAQITFGNNLLHVGMEAFSDCAITCIEIPGNVISVGDYAFFGLSSLNTLTIASATTQFGMGVFGDCRIKNMYVPADFIGYGVWNEYALEMVVITDGTSIPKNALMNASNLTSLTLPNSLESIGENAFANASSLTDLSLPEGLITIGANAFMNASNLTSLTLPNSLESIGEKAFENCPIKDAVVPGTALQYIPKEYLETILVNNAGRIVADTFLLCTNLRDVTLTNCYYIEEYAFYYCVSLENVTFEDSPLHAIYGHAFAECHALVRINIPDTVSFMGESAFENCRSLANINIPAELIHISDFLFSGCTSLNGIEIPNRPLTIGRGAFSDCIRLDYIDIPYTINTIGDYAFSGCLSLKTVTMSINTTSIGTDVFTDCPITNANIPLNFITSIPMGGLETLVISGDGAIPDRAFFDADNLKSVRLLEGITSIGAEAFLHCDSLKTVVVSDSVTSIGPNAFAICGNLISVTLGSGIRDIGNFAFDRCYSIREVYIPSISQWCAISFGGYHANPLCVQYARLYVYSEYAESYYVAGPEIFITVPTVCDYAFYSYDGLQEIEININTVIEGEHSIGAHAFDNCYNLESVIINDGITEIDNYAFAGCDKLTSIVIPDSVTKIGEHVFYNCSNLADIYYTGTVEQWEEISIHYTGNEYFANATIHYNYVPEA